MCVYVFLLVRKKEIKRSVAAREGERGVEKQCMAIFHHKKESNKRNQCF
jgi:hypothetical protein